MQYFDMHASTGNLMQVGAPTCMAYISCIIRDVCPDLWCIWRQAVARRVSMRTVWQLKLQLAKRWEGLRQQVLLLPPSAYADLFAAAAGREHTAFPGELLCRDGNRQAASSDVYLPVASMHRAVCTAT